MDHKTSLLLLFLLLQGRSNYIPSYGSGNRKPRRPSGPSGLNIGHKPPLEPRHIDEMARRMHSAASAMERLNALQRQEELSSFDKLDRVKDSLDAVGDLLADQKAAHQISKISKAVSSTRQIGNIESIVSNIGPLISSLGISDFLGDE